MAASFKGDQTLRKDLKLFFEAAQADVPSSLSGLKVGIGDSGFRLRDGVVFIETEPTTQARLAVIKRCTKLLGSVASHEHDIDDLLWRLAAERASGGHSTPSDKAVSDFLDALETNVDRDFTYIDTNYVVGFEAGVDDLRIGPVRVARTELLSTELKSKQPKAKWELAVGNPSHFVMENGTLTVNLTGVAWWVSLKASEKNVKEQAAWLIDVALSVLRLSHEVAGPFFPAIGEQEAHPLRAQPNEGTSVILVGTRMLTGGARVPAHYRVDPALCARTQTPEFEKYSALFSPKKGSVAERVSQGLGWMTRGRRASDRAERLLYFFTAIEALLSNDDKTAPVTQTIARHASVILAETPSDREAIAAQLKGLYSGRSALVHSGKRNVSKSEADTVQYITEALYVRVFECVDLQSDFQKLNEALGKASYGAAWP